MVLTQHDSRPDSRGTWVLAGGGGVGKSQLAAWFAWHAIEERSTDLVLWVNGASADQVITDYARAAVRAGVPGADGSDPVADAKAFVEWLHTTERSWLVVLDDVVDPGELARWWPPHRARGWTLATTRMRDATMASSGRQQIDVDVYSPQESQTYLSDRLTEMQCAHLLDRKAADLAAALGHLPLALSHAAAYMINQEEGCAAYLDRYTRGDKRLAELMPADVDPDAYGRPVAVTLLVALEAAEQVEPVGLARPALVLAAICDPVGHPDTLWSTTAVTDYLAAHRTARAGQPVTAHHARKALRLLHRYGLLTHAPADGARAVRIHALTARATRETVTDSAAVARVVADALLQVWPDADHATTDIVAALRANTTTMAGIAGDLLWHPDGHPLLYRAGNSLLLTGLHAIAITHWHHMARQAVRLLGDEHPSTLTARGNLATSYRMAGRTADAILIEEKVVVDFARLLGDEHPDTLTARGNLADSYWRAGRTADAILIEEKVLADRERLLGDEHPYTLTARGNLAVSYWRAGRTADAITLQEKLVADSERLLGDEHPDTLTARVNLASSYWQAGRTADAILIEEKVVVDFARLLGDEHPDTLTARGNLATSYQRAGRLVDAITIEEKVVVDSARLLGDEHPSTLTARGNLATSYLQAGRTADAILIEEKLVADSERLLGKEHPSTLTARGNLATSYLRAGRTADAILIEEKVLADRERLLGDEHPDTLTARANLASSYGEAGRTADAITIEERVVADSERLLGDEHPSTLTARGNLACSYRLAGRTAEATTLEEKVLADRERLLGDEHPDMLTARANLAASYRQAGRTADAITLQEKLVADSARLLGENHPHTVRAVAALRTWKVGT
ncbi:tetratricopeptide repeat protein [Micromonospora profundi]|uniref:tetratricopeptide repeat protein n=1 Tax=Micromonospora profundi TaxID=1420889 RepID=UPI0033A3981E